ncbi:DUF2987 domain-containing protein [Paraglaciecola hydrolytica]|uniref:DUF2987 domain-containing protein n=1 Tax=Paraglaciecola hydrolytica TaxID=1799789 RepID=A0A136A6H9_9ALTE|nr:DUF2987 domain-containing protein [Paraglaciecola hydrolytica]KXI30838.1 hypothetical protein AX660_05370 [Paraglaciecola hydrolytica]
MKSLLFFAILGQAVLVQAAYAGQLELEYSSFYNHLKKIDKEDLSALQFSFGFKKVQEAKLCQINKAQLVTQKVTLPIEINSDYRFTLPTEKALNMAKAVVSIELTEPNNQCDMSVQLETKAEYLNSTYSVADLALLNAQYQEFFADMGSFLAFLMPTTNGLKLVFSQPPQIVSKQAGVVIAGNEISLNNEWLKTMSHELVFTEKPLRITAIVKK